MKTYTLENIEYAFDRNSRKWKFRFTNPEQQTVSILVSCGGKPVADKVAEYVNKSAKRTNNRAIDGVARNLINKHLEKVSSQAED